jgi:hypothetical protein
MPLIPKTKIKLTGKKGAAQGLIKFATAQLAILERQMSFQNLNEGRRVVSPFDGVTVECISKFGQKEIRVHVDNIPVPVSSRVPIYEKVPAPIKNIVEDEYGILPLVAHTGTDCAFGILNISEITPAPFESWTALEPGGVNADYSFLQVRYLKELALFDAEIEKEIIFSLKIARAGGRDFYLTSLNYTTTYTIQITSLEEFGDEEIQQIDLPFEIGVSKKVSLSPAHDVHLFALELSYYGADTYNVTANFNADRTKLYVVAWGSGIDNLYPTVSLDTDPAPTSSGTVYVYDRSLVDGVITWTLSFTDTITVPYFMAGAFIDTAGVLSGLYEIILPPASTADPFCVELDYYGTRVDGDDYNVQLAEPVILCATLDLESYSQGTTTLLDSITVAGATTSIGMTITDGDFAPVTMDISNSRTVPFIEGTGDGPTYLWDQSEYCAPWDIDCDTDGHPVCLAQNIPYWIFYNAEVDGYVSSVLPANSIDDTYWHSYLFVNDYGKATGQINSVGILGRTYANTTIFQGNGTGLMYPSTEEYDLYMTKENPVLVRTMFGGVIFDDGERITDYHHVGVGNPDVYGEDPWPDHDITILNITESSIKYPLAIANATGLNGFISHDQNPTDFYSTLELIGVMYQDLSDSNIIKNKITVNGIVMSDEALIATGISTGAIHSIGFIC